jgi:signal transduction histidine kinase
MTGDLQRELPFSTIDPDELVSVFYRMSDYISIHDVVVDQWDSIVDTELVWWNKHYEDIRLRPVRFNQRMTETYFQPHIALSHVIEAWNTGHSLQVFTMNDETQNMYDIAGAVVTTWVNWQRLGDHIVEVGCDLQEVTELQKLVNDQKTLVAVAGRKRAIAVERERIARNLHDVVIQNLYATSLSLAVAGRDKDQETKDAFEVAIAGIDEVIAEIRREILHVESRKASPLRLMLEDALIPILNPTDTELELLIEVNSLPPAVESHVRSVCIEGASNAVRHGGATVLKIRIARMKQQHLVLTIEDNGCGIPSQARLQNGLHNMRERAESLGGNMEIQTNTNGGTTVTWSIPCRGCAQ